MRYALPLTFVAAFVAFSASAHASEADFLKRFEGAFSGAGKVRTAADGNPYNVKCTISGNATETSLNLDGTCRAMAIISRKIGANLKVDGNGVYSGTYVGSKIGPAAVSGRRVGNTVVLAVNWPKPVNGDRVATMTITNTGGGFSFAVDDLDRPGGNKVRMTDVSLSR